MNRGRTLAVISGTGFALLAAYFLVSRQPKSPIAKPAHLNSEPVAVTTSPRPATEHSPAAAPVAARIGATAASPSAQLRREFTAATDLRAFAYAAMKRPHEGGYFYARHAANFCGQDIGGIRRFGDDVIAKELRDTGTVALARLQAAEQVQRLCSSFTPGEVTTLLQQMNANAAAGEDPLLSARVDTIDTLLRKKQWDQAGPLFERLATLNDPLLWTEDQLFRLIVSSGAESRKVGGFYFDGKVYGPEDKDARDVWSALDLAFCGKGPCTIDLRILCVVGRCCSNEEERVKSQYTELDGTEEGWERVLLLAQRARAGIEAGNTAMFVQPKR